MTAPLTIPEFVSRLSPRAQERFMAEVRQEAHYRVAVRHRLPRLHPGQQDVAGSMTRFRVVACGRRWGKTELGKRAAVETAQQGGFVWWVLPNYGLASEAWRDLKRVLAPVIVEKHETEMRIGVSSGGIIQVKSAHHGDEGLRGVGLDLAVLDEAAYMDESAWLGGIRPALSDRQGGALFLSTPNGMNWFHRAFQRGLDPLENDWASWHYPTASNPLIAPEEIIAASAELPERWFAQEYLAAFIEDSGVVFRNIDAVCTGQPEQPIEGHRYAFGVDWARSGDFTAIAVMDTTAKRMVAMDRFNEIAWAHQRGRLRALADRWQPHIILAEANSIGSVNIEALQREGLPVREFNTTAQSKGPLIEGLALAMERQDVTLLDDPVLRGELSAYQIERLPSGTYRYNAPPGSHDDTVIATALAWHVVGAWRRPLAIARAG